MPVERVRDVALVVRGLAPLQRAFKRTEGDLAPTLRKELKALAEPVRIRAQANIPHKTGRHSKDGPLRIKVGVTQKAVSVYSNTVYAGVIERGGRVGHGAILKRATASHYMSKAVRESQQNTEAALAAIGDTIASDFGGGHDG